MEFTVATARERILAVAGALAVGGALAWGFLPACQALAVALSPWIPILAEHGLLLLFPLMAGLSALLAQTRNEPAPLSLGRALKSIPLAAAISAVFGWVRGGPTLSELWATPGGQQSLLWFAVAVPLGEEWLFRGWVYGVFHQWAPRRMLTLTNGLPIALWSSAVAFSLWHLQNLGQEGAGVVAFQVAYTFGAGLWLGYLRWRTNRIFPCILGHLAINLASNLG